MNKVYIAIVRRPANNGVMFATNPDWQGWYSGARVEQLALIAEFDPTDPHRLVEALESIRVDSSPSTGGLHYQIVAPNLFVIKHPAPSPYEYINELDGVYA